MQLVIRLQPAVVVVLDGPARLHGCLIGHLPGRQALPCTPRSTVTQHKAASNDERRKPMCACSMLAVHTNTHAGDVGLTHCAGMLSVQIQRQQPPGAPQAHLQCQEAVVHSLHHRCAAAGRPRQQRQSAALLPRTAPAAGSPVPCAQA